MTAIKLGNSVDQLYLLREEIKRHNHEIEGLRSKAHQIEQDLLKSFVQADLLGATGKLGRLTIKLVMEPTIEDFVLVFRYASRTKNYGLLQRRLNAQAVRELWDVGKEIPGVGTFNRTKISVLKLI